MPRYRKYGFRSVIAFVALALLGSCGQGDVITPSKEQEPTYPKDAAQGDPVEGLAPRDAAAGGAADTSWTVRAPNAKARTTLSSLRERFVERVAVAPAEPSDDDSVEGNAVEGNADAGDASLMVAAPTSTLVPVLGPAVVDRFEEGPGGLRPQFPAGARVSARVLLPARSTAATRLEEPATGTAIEFAREDARESPGEVADGYVLYERGHAFGASVLVRALPEGCEDFISFAERPAQPSVKYRVLLLKGVSGLRLVANTLEMVDEKGAPRLRVAPPSIVGADGVRTDAKLDVEGCSYDESPAAPWGRAVTRPGADACTVRVTWKDDAVVYPALLDPRWSDTASMIDARQNHTSTMLTMLSTGKVLVVGGVSTGGSVLNKAELYDPSTGTWAAAAAINGARQWHSASQLPASSNPTSSGKVLIAGGWTGTQSVSTTRFYSPTDGTWANGADMGTPRHLHTATVLSDGRVLATGGMGGSTVFQSGTLYTPGATTGNGTWNATPNMAVRRRWHTATLLSTTNATLNNKVLVVGGNTGNTTSTNSVQLFDPSLTTPNWVSQNPPPALALAREGHTATVMGNGKVLVVGGKNGTTLTAGALFFDPASGSGSWVNAGNLNFPRQQHIATRLSTSVLNQGAVLVAGGSLTGTSPGTTSTNVVELFDGTSTWTTTSTPLLTAVRDHTAALLDNGVVMIAGGIETSAPVNNVQLYDPSTGISCTSASQCASKNCVAGVCCNEPCTEECAACNIAGSVGVCTAKSGGIACTDDGNLCTTDTCNGTSKFCPHAPVPAGTSCSDLNACNGVEMCNAAGVCTPGTPPNGLPCNDGDACTRTDVCAAGVCRGTSVPGCAAKITVDDLGTLGGTYTAAIGITDDGVVVGHGNDPSGTWRVIRWSPGGGPQQVGDIVGYAGGINNGGVIAGTSYTADPATGSTAFRYSDASGLEVLSPSGAVEWLQVINQSNSVVGTAIAPGSNDWEALRYTQAHGRELLGILPGDTYSYGLWIDDQNNVVGGSSAVDHASNWFNEGRAFRYVDAENRLQDLNEYAPLGWKLRFAGATNGDEIVGAAEHESVIQAFRLTLSTGRVDDLGALGGMSRAWVITGDGVILGDSHMDGSGIGHNPPQPTMTPPAAYRATVYTEQLGLVNLNAAADPAQGWILSDAFYINHNGDVVGIGFHEGQTRAFRMHVPGLIPARVPRCQTGADCATGFCAEGICCNTACDGQCSSCRLPGTFGTCTQRPVGSRCTNGNQCTSVDTCNAGGVCVSGGPPVQNDGNPCTTDTCDPVTGVKHTPVAVGTSCSDGNACNGADTCAAGGVCTPGTPVVCPGADQCRTAGTCDPATGVCSNAIARDGLPCNDSDTCTRTDVCQAGVCAGSAVPGCVGKIAVEDLGTLGGWSEAFGINNEGVVVGDSEDAAGVIRPVRWLPGGSIEQLGTQTGSAYAVNDTGTIGGWVDDSSFLYTNATGFQIITQAGTGSGIDGLNNQGSAVGWSWALDLAFRYTNAKGYETLGVLPGRPKAWAWDIDDQNNAVGSSFITSSARIDGHAIRYIDAESRLQDLNEFAPLGWELRDAIATNGDEIVGYARMSGEPQRAYRLTLSTGQVDDLGPPARSSGAGSINAHGAVALLDWDEASTTVSKPSVYTEQLGLVDLNTVADPALGWNLQDASGINDNGDVVGWGQHNGQMRAFRMHVPGLNPARVPRCQTGADCATGFCAEGICCNTACTDQCSSCRLPGTFGTCTQKREGSRCTNGNQCTSVDTCNASGVCVSGGPPVQDDGNPCTTDTCDPVTGVKHTPVAVGASCSDGNACNGAETCNAAAVCTPGAPTVIDDGNPCTQDSCDPVVGPVHTPVPVGVSCSDGNACNGAETCNANGVCIPGTPLNCGVTDQCHLAGTCDPVTGACSNPRPNGLPCNDGDACTRTDVCQAGFCTGTTVPGCAAKIPVEDLGTLGAGWSYANSINNAGVVVGSSAEVANGLGRPVRWLPGGSIQQLGTQTGVAYVVNNTGVVAGDVGADTVEDPSRPYLYTDANGFQIITAAGTSASIDGLNDQGSAAGWNWALDFAFLYTNARGYERLASLPGRPSAWAWSLDNQNNVVGSSWITWPPDTTGHAFRYIDAERRVQDLNELAPLGWELRDAFDTNGDEIVGYATVNAPFYRAYRITLSTGRVDDLGTLEGDSSRAYNINGHGAIIGWSYQASQPANYRPTVYTEQLGNVDLNAAADPAQGWIIRFAYGINDNGDIVGGGTHNGQQRAFRMHVPGLNPARVPRCQNNNECATGFCVEGICCNTACNDACSSCRLAGTFGTCSPRPAGSRCSPASVCDGGGDVCNASGACVPGTPPVIDDGNPCTTDSCDPSTGAQHVPTPGASCSDGNACNGAEICDATGQCGGGTPVICGFPDACHLPGTCNPATGVCLYPPAPPDTRCGDTNDCNGIEICDGAGNCGISGAPPDFDDDNPCTVDGCDDTTGQPTHTPLGQGAPCESLCLTGGTGTCDGSHTCVGGTAVTCTAADQCHGVGTCNPMTGECSSPPVSDGTACDDGVSCTLGDTCQAGLCGAQSHACTPDCPCGSGGTCTTDNECSDDLVCGPQNGRLFGKDPLSSNCWPPACPVDPYYIGCGHLTRPCGLCPPAPPRVCTSDTDCQGTNEVCGQGNGVAFELGNVNVCWPPICAGGQTFCGSLSMPCGNCACTTTCGSKTCSTEPKSDGCGGYCAGLCGDGQTGCTSNLDCRGDSICAEGTCLPPICLVLDPSRNCPGDHAACPNCPECAPLCASEGRACGPDPAGCPAGCGSCTGGLSCIDGKCLGPAGPPLRPVDPTAQVGALEGSFSVTDGGQAQYSINIAVPPGRAGLQPDIGLVYSSDKKLGPAGIGWRLTGFSQIARCATRAANEMARAVQYDGGDRFCLDGKRLIALADGTYRTEVDQFSKTVVTARDGLGQPVSFKVYTKAGTILTYGDTDATSVFHVLDLPYRVMKRAWAISRVEDRNGNSMHFAYDARRSVDNQGRLGDTSEMLPREVSYGANTAAGFENDRGVHFSHNPTGIRSRHFVNGSEVTMQQALGTVETYVRNTGVVRRYRFGYEEKGNVFRLISAKECTSDTPGPEVCKIATTFSYFDGNQGTALSSSAERDANHDRKLANWRGMSADTNGDGTDDWWLKGTGTDGQEFGTGVDGSAIDLNNDGHETILYKSVLLNTATGDDELEVRNADGSTRVYPFQKSPPWHASRAFAADIDGDGLKDVIVWNDTKRGYLKGGTITTTSPVFHNLPPPDVAEKDVPLLKDAPLLIDVDDDGVVNLLRKDDTSTSSAPTWSYYVLTSPGIESGTWKPLLFSGGASPRDITHFAKLDANGDGLVDLLEIAVVPPPPFRPASSPPDGTLWLNQGDGSFRKTKSEPVPLDPNGDPSGLVFDFNGDGNDDYVMGYNWIQWQPSTLTTDVRMGVFSPIVRFDVPEMAGSHFAAFLADINGDGDLDLIDGAGPVRPGALPPCQNFRDVKGEIIAACPPQTRLGSSRRIHLLTDVLDGVGRKVHIDYSGNTKVTLGVCAGKTDLLCPTKFPPLVGEHHFSTVSPQGTETTRKVYQYSYADAHAGTNGRGSYGFGKRVISEFEAVEDQPTPMLFSTTNLTYYNDDFERAGLLKSRTVTSAQPTQYVPGVVLPARRIVEETRDYQVRQNHAVSTSDPSLTVVFPVLRQSMTQIFDVPDLTRLVVSTEVNDFITETVDDGYDDYGNNRHHARWVYAGDLSSEIVTQSITTPIFQPADVDNWLVGLLESTEVTDTRNGASETRKLSYGYYPDGSGRLHLRTRDPGGPFQQVEEFFYEDAVHNLTRRDLSRVVAPDDGSARSTAIVYDEASLTFPHYTDNALGHRTTTTFDPRHGGIIETQDPNGLTETRTYDAFGRLTKVEGPSGSTRITLMKRDATVFLAPAPDSRAVMRVWTQELSSSGATTGAMKLEDFGPLGEILKRDVTGYVKSGLDQWVEETFSYYPVGRLKSQTRPHLLDTTEDQGEIKFRYDKTGQLIEEIHPDEGRTTSVYHASATRITWAGDPGAYFIGPAVGVELISQRVPSTTDGAAAAFAKGSTRILDPEGLTVAARDAGGTFNDYTYGPFRQLGMVHMGRDTGVYNIITYDTYGRKKSHSDPDRGLETYDVYNAFDELESVTGARGAYKTYTYDKLGRMLTANGFVTGIPVPDEKTRWEYDTIAGEPVVPNEIGRLVRVSAGSDAEPTRHQTRYHYQGAGSFGLLAAVERKIAADTFTTAFNYESDFHHLQVVEYPTAGGVFAVQRTYDFRGNLIKVADATPPAPGDPPKPPYWQVSETSQGYRIESETLGNNAVTTSIYEPFTGRLKTLKTVSPIPDGGVVPLQGFAYTYTPNGNLETRANTTAPRFETFGYDDLDRLTGIARDGQPEAQVAAYDFRGRIQSKVGAGTYDYDSFPTGAPRPLHAPHKVVNNGVTRTFTYDASGNEIERTGGPEGTRTTEYTSFNLPLSITDTAPQLSTTFEYDGDQTRVIKLENNVRQTVYAGSLYERVTDSSAGGPPAVTHKYRIFVEGKQIAQLERKEGTPGDTIMYLHGDHLGSTQLVTKGTPDPSSALILHQQTFDPWGKPESTAAWEDAAISSVHNVHTGFTGHEHDPEHGLINMRGRIYDPELGRFMTADPIVQSPFNSQSFNRYAYVFNNPLRYTDPSGFLQDSEPAHVETSSNGEIVFSDANVQAKVPSTSPSEGTDKPDSSAIGAEGKGGTVAGTKEKDPGGGGEVPQTGPEGGTSTSPAYDTGQSQGGMRAALAADTSKQNPGREGRSQSGGSDSSHNDQVAQRISDYREPGGSNFDAWDRAREDYREINLKGGDPVLRDAEHYLFRYWLGSMGTKFGRIPNGLPIKGSPNPTIWLNSTLIENVHDPAYNALRPIVEKVLNIAPTTPEMKEWEQRGFQEGYCASGDCGTGKRVQEILFGSDPADVGPSEYWSR